MPAIEVDHLTKHYGPARGVIDLNFSVRPGEIMGFLGPNGSGKTTTMRMLTCFFPPSSGTARVAGYDICRNPLDVRRSIGYLPESVPLYRDMPVRSYLTFFAEVRGVAASLRRSRVDDAIDRCGLAHVAHRLIGKLSKGYRQRVGIAQSLLHNPAVLILDEPTVGLDPRQIIEIRNLIKDLGTTQTVILSTHILPEVSMTCDRVIIIHEGRLIAVDTPENLTSRLQQSPQVLLRAAAPADELAATIAGVTGVRDVRVRRQAADGSSVVQVSTDDSPEMINALARAVADRTWQLREIRPADMTLEEIFIHLVTEETGVTAA